MVPQSLRQERHRVLQIDVEDEPSLSVLKALASEPRLQVLNLLTDKVANVSEIAEAMDIPLSTATLHVSSLEDAGLITTDLQPASRGLQKICARAYDTIVVKFPDQKLIEEESFEVSMPIGAYVACNVAPTCGLTNDSAIIGLFDDPAAFYEPARVQAQLLWFHHGYVEYLFPNRLPPEAVPETLTLSLEACSEAPLHHENWPSDITLWVNELEIGTWTSPADFGGKRGALTPKWWGKDNTQYGLLKIWQVKSNGSFVDGTKVSDVDIDQLQLSERNPIKVRIGVKPDAKHVGGISIFGRHFGNYPQDIVMRVRYQ